MYGVDRYSSEYGLNYYGSPIITEKVLHAICLYRSVINRLKERVEDSSNIMISLNAETGGIALKEVYEDIEEQFAIKRRIYAPQGSSMDGVNFALADVDTASKPFFENLSMETGIPLWMFERDVNNSQFIIESKEYYLQKMFLEYVLEPLQYVFKVWGIGVDIKVPSYRSESYKLDMAAKEADTEYKKSASKRLNAITDQLNNPVQTDKKPATGSVGGRTI
jgi:hypothetical protein